jgi:phytoene dehydrogenase-like protein
MCGSIAIPKESEMAEKSIIIVGAGIAGLSAGCYLQMNGYRTQIHEMHIKAGGLCTGWERKGYHIGTIGWVTGSGPANNDFYPFWQELGAVKDWSIVNYEEYARFVGRSGREFVLYADIDRLEQHLLEIAPEDEKLIAGFVGAIRAFTQFKMPQDKPPELFSPWDRLKMMAGMLPVMLGPMGKWLRMSISDFAAQFKNPFLREIMSEGLVNAFFFDANIALMMVLNTLASLHLKSSGYPLGGSLVLVHSLEQRYLGLGGEIQFRSRVAKILVEADRAVGVRLADGSEHRADIVISAADGRTTLFDMLEGKYISDKVRRWYEAQPLTPPILFVSLGVSRTFEKTPPSILGEVWALEKPIAAAGSELHWLGAHVYDFDPGLAPEGSTLIRVMLPSDYQYWADLRATDRARYREEKQRVVDQVIAALDQRHPGLAEQVEMCDVSTPATFERYTGNWKGTYLGWLMTPNSMTMSILKTLPGLESFYRVGTWEMSSSLAYAATAGRQVTQIICNRDKRPFVTTLP